MAERSSKSDSIFWAALGIAAPEERDRYLDEACADDPNQRAQLDELLAAYPKVERFLEQPANGDATIHHEPSITERPGTVIGPYKLLQQIGEGGMGVVFMAEQTEPIQRTVALKIIKPGMDTRQVIARFEAERQALAMMDHPNIAKVLDAGTTDSGRPYFVMELVKGVPITKYCDEKHLPLRARLELLLPVCQAVQHAHQKGVIHRDIKPTNVLVAEFDDHAVPKVIDFGVAKATSQKLTDRTMFTEFGQVLGTVEYMSPEQAKFNQLDIDTRSDIYSLGVLLYELLTGSTPFGRKRLNEAAFDEALRIIREEEPQKPSTRLSTTAELASIAANRALEPGKLSGVVKGELDWIVMKALEKDRNRRYDTAGNFAADVLRHLSDQPVEACPPSAAYRFRKFIRRNRVAVLAGSAIAVALMLGLTLSAIGFVQARRQAVRADREASNARTEAANAIVAKGQTEAALVEKDDALKAVQEKELLQRRRFYSAQMNLAQQALVAGDPARVLDLLENNRPRSGETDLRGFEWSYLWQQIHPGLRAECFYPSDVDDHWGLAASPDGSSIAVDSGLGNFAFVKLWSTTTGKSMRTLAIRKAGPTLLAFSPDGKLLASGSGASSTICLWNVAKGSEIASTSLNLGLVRSLQFAPDGKNLAAGFETGAVQVLDAASLKTIAKLKPHGGPVLNVCYAPDGARLYSAAAWGTEDTLTRVHEMTKNPPEAVDELKGFRVTDISPDGRLLVGGWRGMTLWNIAEKKAVWQFVPHTGVTNDVKFTPDGTSLITAGVEDRLAIMWDIATRKAITRVPHRAQVSAVACVGNKGGIWVSLSNEGTAKIWEPIPEADQSIIRLDKPIKTMIAMPDGRAVMLGGDFRAKTWDLDAGMFHDNPSEASYVRSISTDGRWLASTELVDPSNRRGVKTWDLASGALQHVITMPENKFPSGIRISPDGKRLAISRYEWPIQIWDLTGKEVKVPAPDRTLEGENCRQADFSPDGRWLAAACQFGRVNLYDLESKQIVRLRMPRSPGIEQVAFSGDGKRLAAGTDIGLVYVFDIKTAKIIASFAGHEGSIAALIFFPDGHTLAVASRNAIRIWDVPSQQERITLTVALGADLSEPVAVEDLAITSDGEILLARQSDGTVRVWRIAGEAADHATGAPVDKNPGTFQEPENKSQRKGRNQNDS